MALIQWTDSLSVGVSLIDQQHQKLISLINELNEAMREGRGKDLLLKILKGLIDYTHEHFSEEEKYFDLFGYDEAVPHKKEHALFVAKIGDFKKGFEEDRLGLSVEVMNFMSSWLKKHIQGTDRKYIPLFKQKGLT